MITGIVSGIEGIGVTTTKTPAGSGGDGIKRAVRTMIKPADSAVTGAGGMAAKDIPEVRRILKGSKVRPE